jgi:elongation factor Ts
MSKVSMDDVKKLRDRTQVGMMDCRKALEEANGDIEKAVEILRKKGAAVAAKRSENVTNHGRIESFINANHTIGSLIETACETDFAANTEAMQYFARDVAEHVATVNPTDVATLLTQPCSKNPKLTIQQHLDDLISKICESIKVNRFVRFQVAGDGIVNAYIHPGSTVGILVELATDKPIASHLEALKTIAKDICMQVAVTNPLCIKASDLDPAALEKERNLAREQLKDSGKPANVIDKIIEGKLGKFYQDACLLNQPFIKNDKLTVQQYINEESKKLGINITIKQFKRFGIGR